MLLSLYKMSIYRKKRGRGEGCILEDKNIIENLINLDSQASEINEKRKGQLQDLSQKYREDEQNIIKDYKKQIDQGTRSAIEKIELETKQEISQIRLENKNLLENMQQKFEQNLKGIVDEIMKRIFELKRQDNISR